MLSPSPCFWQPGMRNLIPLEAGAARRSSEFEQGCSPGTAARPVGGTDSTAAAPVGFPVGIFLPSSGEVQEAE